MKYKILIKTTSFILIFCVLFHISQELLRAKWGSETAGARETLNYSGFYAEPKNSLDVLFIGSSQVFFGISPLTIWDQCGIPSYAKGSANQYLYFSYYSLKDALRVQKPKIVVFDTMFLFSQYDPVKDEWISRRALDYMQMSPIKLEAICNLNLEGSNQSQLSYIFPFHRYHSRWAELNKIDFEYFAWDEYNAVKGQFVGYQPLEFEMPENRMQLTDTVLQSPEEVLNYFEKLVSLCEENDIQLVLIKTPVATLSWNYGKHLGTKRLAEQYEIPFIDYNMKDNWDSLGLDTTKDFYYNGNHLSAWGAEKFSKHLAISLKEYYNLEDKRADPSYAAWNRDLEQYKTALASEKGKLVAATQK